MRQYSYHTWTKLLIFTLMFFVTPVVVLAGTAHSSLKVAFLVADKPGEIIGPDMSMACELAERITDAVTILSDGKGGFVDRSGKARSLDQFAVIWCHHDDTALPIGKVFAGPTLDTLGKFVSAGHGLLLSGCAVPLVNGLGVDTIRVNNLPFGDDRDQSGLVPLDLQHPVFSGADLFGGVLWMSNAVFPAFAGLHPSRNPSKGVFLARAAGGPDNPLVEYQLGQGRIIVMGWRLGRLYGDAAIAYRKNYEKLTTNITGYLGNPKSWKTLAMKADGSPVVNVQLASVSGTEWRALEMAIRDLSVTFNERYKNGDEYIKRLLELKKAQDVGAAKLVGPATGSGAKTDEIRLQFIKLRNEALLANPLLDFSKLLLVKRSAKQLGLPMNYLSNSSLSKSGYDNQIAVLSPLCPDGKLTTLYQPKNGQFVGDVDLHFDADRLLFSMPVEKGPWRVFEIGSDGSNLLELSLIQEPDVDNYDACYLPDDRVIFTSSACFAGVPCINGSGHVANLYSMDKNGRIRQLTVDQDHDWCPTVLNNGRILYLRWEYTDLPHAFSRILFHMNPDGTGQSEYYGSNSYWPASMFFARPIPGHSSKFIAITGGHHEMPRMGDLVIFDPALGRFEADGVVQQIPGYGRKLAPANLDLPIAQSWPKFLHPYPLSEKYFITSCKPSAADAWGIYLVDVFDNMVLIYEEPGYAMLEPIPFMKTPKSPVIADKVDLNRKDADVLISDVYLGEGLKGVPRGTIKSLRIFTYEFAYQGMGAEPYSVGLDGPWDPKIVLGTVPVYEDGSAHFRIPAYTPVAIQPLDIEGKAVQLMRSWITAMPGEPVSCVGCHEKQNTLPPIRRTIATGKIATEIKPWYGPARGFSFAREVQPVLDKYCVSCHSGKSRSDGKVIPSLVDGPPVPTMKNNNGMNQASRFPPSYYELRKFVRTPSKESDMHLLMPWEYHADTTRLVQMLSKGHHDVKLDTESWDRIITWIDLNAPSHGGWQDIRGGAIGPAVKHQTERRLQMRERYTGMGSVTGTNPEQVKSSSVHVEANAVATSSVKVDGNSPVAIGETSVSLEKAGEMPSEMSVDLGSGILLKMVRVQPGEFIMGQEDGCADEKPVAKTKMAKGFWIGRYEITNEQFGRFDSAHNSRLEDADFMQFSMGERGWTVARPSQPVVRVSWNKAMDFCRWLSQKTDKSFSLPTEAEWEFACRAGTTTRLWYGETDSDFSRSANVSDICNQVVDPFDWGGRGDVIPPWRPADIRFNDKYRVTAPVGTYRPNPWGLFDMHGNVAEWTASEYRPYPYSDSDGRNSLSGTGRKVVRGGSWYDRPERCRSAFRQAYKPAQPVYDVGFRVVCR